VKGVKTSRHAKKHKKHKKHRKHQRVGARHLSNPPHRLSGFTARG
jgi:hypothetical protein